MRERFTRGNPHHAGGAAQATPKLLVTRDDADIRDRAPANGQGGHTLETQFARKAFEPGIGGDISALSRAADHGRGRGIDDEEIKRLLRGRGGKVLCALELRREHRAQAIGLEAGDHAVFEQHGGMDDAAHRAEIAGHARDECVDRGGIIHVEGCDIDCRALRAHGVDDCSTTFFYMPTARGEYDGLGTPAGQPARGGEAKTEVPPTTR